MYTLTHDPLMIMDELELVGQFRLSCVSLMCCQYVQANEAISLVLEGYTAKMDF